VPAESLKPPPTVSNNETTTQRRPHTVNNCSLLRTGTSTYTINHCVTSSPNVWASMVLLLEQSNNTVFVVLGTDVFSIIMCVCGKSASKGLCVFCTGYSCLLRSLLLNKSVHVRSFVRSFVCSFDVGSATWPRSSLIVLSYSSRLSLRGRVSTRLRIRSATTMERHCGLWDNFRGLAWWS